MKSIIISLIFCSVFTVTNSQPDTLPKPTGKYFVGVTYSNFIDPSRKEIFYSTQSSLREITTKVWYPSDQKSDIEPYFLEAEANITTTSVKPDFNIRENVDAMKRTNEKIFQFHYMKETCSSLV